MAVVYAVEVTKKGSRKLKPGQVREGFYCYCSAQQVKPYPAQVFAKYDQAKSEVAFLAAQAKNAKLALQVCTLYADDLMNICPKAKANLFGELIAKWVEIGKIAA